MSVASMKNPIYSVKIVSCSDGTVYNVTKALTDLIIGHNENDFSQRASFSIANAKVGGSWYSSKIRLKDKVYIYCDTGSGAKEVFRGVVWDRGYDESLDGKDIKVVAYDKLIFLQNSEDNLYFANGKSTKAILSSIASKWGISLTYNYSSITHGKLVFRGNYLSDVIVEILDAVKKKTGKKYVIRCEKGTMIIEPFGTNTTIYELVEKQNAIKTSYSATMDGMVTKVLIIGSENKSGQSSNLATVKGNTSQYGTLQKVLSKSDDDKLSEIKKEAQQIIKDDGSPKIENSVLAISNPHIKKGHKVKINAGNLNNNYYVLGIEQDCLKKEMSLEVVKA